MSLEATSALTLGDLVLEIARKSGVAFYGDDGTEAAQVPQDDHDLAECKRHVNNAIRMFIAEAPKAGWRWTRIPGSITTWASVTVDATKTVTGGTYDQTNDQTLLTATSAVFYESMEEKDIVVTDQDTFVIKRYVSSTEVYVYGNHSFAAAATYAVIADGNYTLPRSFAGGFTGQVTFAPATNRALRLLWVDEATIRENRENVTVQIGTPRQVALEIFEAVSGRKRYRLAVYPTPDEIFVLQFPYDIHFDTMIDLDESPPTPIVHDDTLKAACLAIVETDVDETPGIRVDYYTNKALPNSHRLDARSGPRRLGYFGNDRATVTPRNFRDFTDRQDVTYS